MIAKVEPLTPARSLRGPFDYRLGALEGVRVGTMLVVPFGRRRILGVVVGLEATSEVPAERLVEPLAALDGGVPPELVRLGLWVAREYCSTPSRGLALVLPPGTGTAGMPRVRARRAVTAALAPTRDGEPVRAGPRQRAILEALASGPVEAGALLRATGASRATLRGLERRGLVTLEESEVVPVAPALARPSSADSGPEGGLTRAQAEALAAVMERLDAGGVPRPLLLHGVTGSGKTEVYLRAAASALERGRSAIVLVPEIALTPQTARRFEARFGSAVAVLHSRLSARERYDEWTRLRSGQARVCVGPRSAVFAPVPDLGLIVIDEEHDGSYKQEGDPRYDARRVAERRAAEAGAVLLAGTATPRPETWLRFDRVSLPERVDGRDLPPVELVRAAGGTIHPRTRAALDEVRERGEKAIVLLNRRGWSNFLSCRGCGHTWGCPDCDVTLVLHRAAGELSCHHCGHRERVPTACPGCGSVSVVRHGTGTERLEEELSRLVDPLPVMRLDADAAGGRTGVIDALERFDAAPAGVLVGTQMVAKGHDFPDVTLAVVLDADATLRFPDFRAEERAFALVAQLAGRSGRGPRGGRVIVQALEPDSRPLRFAAAHDAGAFLADELRRREALRYPPFAHLVRVVCSARLPGPELAAAEAVRDGIRARAAAIEPPGGSVGAELSVLGPAALFRLKGRERAQVVVKSSHRASAVECVRETVDAVARERGREVAFAVDVDPQ